MESANGNGGANGRPRLVFFFSKASGRSRRVEGYLSQVLQRRRNHESFELLNVDVDENADLAERFAIEEVPTIVVVEEQARSTAAWRARAAAGTSSSCSRPGCAEAVGARGRMASPCRFASVDGRSRRWLHLIRAGARSGSARLTSRAGSEARTSQRQARGAYAPTLGE